MLVNNQEVEKRLSSPLNLLNRLRGGDRSPERAKAMSLFGVGSKKVVEVEADFNPFKSSKGEIEEVSEDNSPNPPTVDDLMGAADNKIKLEMVHNSALSVMSAAVSRIGILVPTLDKPEKLADIASKMSKIVGDIKDKNKTRGEDKQVHLHFYTPNQKAITDYEVVEV
jgi:hypothetical protein